MTLTVAPGQHMTVEFQMAPHIRSARGEKELGIRVALGARRWELLIMILLETLSITGLGVGIGILLGIGATAIFRAHFYGIGPLEWTVLLPVSTAMFAVSLLVAYVSARPWITVDPMQAVRHV